MTGIDLWFDPYFTNDGRLRGNYDAPDVDVRNAQRRIQESAIKEQEDRVIASHIASEEEAAHHLRVAALAPLVGTFLSFMGEAGRPGTHYFQVARKRGWFIAIQLVPTGTDWPHTHSPIALSCDGEMFAANQFTAGQPGAKKWGDGGCATFGRVKLSGLAGSFTSVAAGTALSAHSYRGQRGQPRTIEQAVAESIALICEEFGLRWPGIQAGWQQRRGRTRTGWRRRLLGAPPHESWPWNLGAESARA